MSAFPQFDRATQPWLGKNRIRGELYLVPQEMIARAWRDAKYAIQAPKMGIGRGYDIERLHGRLLLGTDRLWLAAFTRAYESLRDCVAGVVITSLGAAPKDAPYLFDRKDGKALTAHFIAGRNTEAWIADAVEKVARYGEEKGCKQLFALARTRWLHYLYPLYGRFERVGLARDRLMARGRDMRNGGQRPGRFRLLLKDLPPGMGYECARHQRTRIYISKGVRHVHSTDAANAAALSYAAQ